MSDLERHRALARKRSGHRLLRRCVGAVGVVTWLAASGCAGQAQHFDDRDWTKDHGIQSGAWREAETLFTDDADVDNVKHTLRGVRHDLTLRPGAEPDTRCACLDVAIGTPADPRFDWAGERPAISPDNLVIAMRTSADDCPAGRRPSIQAVDSSGKAVTVVIEELGFERPQALGAVIGKPGDEGSLWVQSARSKKGKLPYARSSSGRDACRVQTDPKLHHLQIRAGRRF